MYRLDIIKCYILSSDETLSIQGAPQVNCQTLENRIIKFHYFIIFDIV